MGKQLSGGVERCRSCLRAQVNMTSLLQKGGINSRRWNLRVSGLTGQCTSIMKNTGRRNRLTGFHYLFFYYTLIFSAPELPHRNNVGDNGTSLRGVEWTHAYRMESPHARASWVQLTPPQGMGTYSSHPLHQVMSPYPIPSLPPEDEHVCHSTHHTRWHVRFGDAKKMAPCLCGVRFSEKERLLPKSVHAFSTIKEGSECCEGL